MHYYWFKMVKYKNMTRAKCKVKEILEAQPVNKPFQNDDIYSLLLNHPTKKIASRDDIEYVVRRKHPRWKNISLYVKVKDSEEDVISYIYCIKHLFKRFDVKKNKRAKIVSAFRYEISSTSRRQFFYTKLDEVEKNGNSWYGICAKCDQRKKITSDHKPPNVFKKILNDFLILKQQSILDVHIHCVGETYMLTDTQLKHKWITYHDSLVEWQFLCVQCNSKQGSCGF